MNKIFKIKVGSRDISCFYLNDKNVLLVREGLGCFVYEFYYWAFSSAKVKHLPLFRLFYNLSESAIEMRYGLDDEAGTVLGLENDILGSVG